MDKMYILCILIYSVMHVHGNEQTISKIMQNVIQQTGYGLMHTESRHDLLEYNINFKKLILDQQFGKGLKSLMMEQADNVPADWTDRVGISVSAVCLNDSSEMFKDLKNGTGYALSMLDADGKPGSGIEHGNLYFLGNREECEQVQTVKFKGQMCNVVTTYNAAQVVFLTVGVCFPDSCNDTDITIITFEALSRLKIYPIAVSCPETLQYSTGDLIALVVCGIIALALVMGTLADIVYMYRDSYKKRTIIRVRSGTSNYGSLGPAINHDHDATERLGLLSNVTTDGAEATENQVIHSNTTLQKFFISFSIISNTRKLLNTSTASGSLTAVNGMRVLSMWWVILGHTFAFILSMTDNLLDMVEIVKRFTFQWVMNGTYSVDTFFFMSGLLVAYVSMKKLREEGRINWIVFYVHRFWRLTPVYAFAIMIWSTLYRHWIWNGSFVTLSKKLHPTTFDYCNTYWWTNILYINNFHPNLGNIDKQCMGWGWYLANDMQFYILSPLFLILLHRMKYLGHGVLLFFVTGSIISRVVTADYYSMRIPDINTAHDHTEESWAQSSPLYNKPYSRIAPYIVGIWLGYLLVINNCRVRLGKAKLLIGCCIAIATGMSVIFGLYYFYKDYPNKSGGKAESLAYIGLGRFAWSLALAWIVFVCAVGHGGPVNKFLSWRVWAPLGRLTYCAYIVHPAVLLYFYFNMETAFHYSDMAIIQMFIAVLVTSYCVAFVLSMAVEAPMLGLEKLVFKFASNVVQGIGQRYHVTQQ